MLHLGGVNLPIATKLGGLDQPALDVLQDGAAVEAKQVGGLLGGEEISHKSTRNRVQFGPAPPEFISIAVGNITVIGLMRVLEICPLAINAIDIAILFNPFAFGNVPPPDTGTRGGLLI